MKVLSDGAASEPGPECGEGANPLKSINTVSFRNRQWAPHTGCCGFENVASGQPVPMVIGQETRYRPPRGSLLVLRSFAQPKEKVYPAQ